MDEIPTELSKKEKRFERRELERRMIEREVKLKKLKKYAYIILPLLIVVLGVWYIWRAGVEVGSGGTDLSREYPLQGRDHIPEGTPHEPYDSNPPTSGPHWADPVRDGVYDRTQPDEGLIHSLEHGRIWISYKPSIPEAARKKLEDIAGGNVRVILTSRPQNDTDVAVAAWRRLDTFNLSPDGTFDESRILDFIRRYRDKGPEYIPQMTGRVY
ncbi:MAG: DUF3105 domain-containing protein [Candidatus Ryanbacteria bacterium]|nr:DUF3105 domain-containing protein [Candidatus Ryanbacteria bacterium]